MAKIWLAITSWLGGSGRFFCVFCALAWPHNPAHSNRRECVNVCGITCTIRYSLGNFLCFIQFPDVVLIKDEDSDSDDDSCGEGEYSNRLAWHCQPHSVESLKIPPHCESRVGLIGSVYAEAGEVRK